MFDNEGDVYSYSAFSLDKLYPAERGIYNRNIQKLSGLKQLDLHSVVKASLAQLGSKYSLEDFIIGFYRTTPLNGYEYELFFKQKHALCCTVIRLLKPIQNLRITEIQHVHEKKTINFIICLTAGKLKKLSSFLNLFNLVALQQDKAFVSLTIVFTAIKANTQIERIINEFKMQTKFSKINLIYSRSIRFSRASSLELGVENANQDDLLFFCDIDIIFTQLFLDMCRLNTEKSKKVYFPILYSFYNPNILNKSTESSLIINKETGFWRDSGFGMVCVYKQDFKQVNGFGAYANKSTWGGEDLHLYRKFLNHSRLEVVRSIAPSLFHMYHEKECNQSQMSANEYANCVSVKTQSETSLKNYGLFYFNLTKLI